MRFARFTRTQTSASSKNHTWLKFQTPAHNHSWFFDGIDDPQLASRLRAMFELITEHAGESRRAHPKAHPSAVNLARPRRSYLSPWRQRSQAQWPNRSFATAKISVGPTFAANNINQTRNIKWAQGVFSKYTWGD